MWLNINEELRVVCRRVDSCACGAVRLRVRYKQSQYKAHPRRSSLPAESGSRLGRRAVSDGEGSSSRACEPHRDCSSSRHAATHHAARLQVRSHYSLFTHFTRFVIDVVLFGLDEAVAWCIEMIVEDDVLHYRVIKADLSGNWLGTFREVTEHLKCIVLRLCRRCCYRRRHALLQHVARCSVWHWNSLYLLWSSYVARVSQTCRTGQHSRSHVYNTMNENTDSEADNYAACVCLCAVKMVVVSVLLCRYQVLRRRGWSSVAALQLRSVQVEGARAVPNVEGWEACRRSRLLWRWYFHIVSIITCKKIILTVASCSTVLSQPFCNQGILPKIHSAGGSVTTVACASAKYLLILITVIYLIAII